MYPQCLKKEFKSISSSVSSKLTEILLQSYMKYTETRFEDKLKQNTMSILQTANELSQMIEKAKQIIKKKACTDIKPMDEELKQASNDVIQANVDSMLMTDDLQCLDIILKQSLNELKAVISNSVQPVDISVENTTASVEVTTIEEGTGSTAANGNTISVHYVSTLEDDTKSDSFRGRNVKFTGRHRRVRRWIKR
jgi:FKBP-type peptidyl-prolyl cis-trans isomerase